MYLYFLVFYLGFSIAGLIDSFLEPNDSLSSYPICSISLLLFGMTIRLVFDIKEMINDKRGN